MRLVSAGHAIFAVTMIGLGIWSLAHGFLSPVWDPVPRSFPTYLAVYFSAIVSLVSGVGLLFTKSAAPAARLLLVVFLFWLVLFRLPRMATTPGVDSAFASCEMLVMLAAAWILYQWFSTAWDRQRLASLSRPVALRLARGLSGVSLVFFGVAHFLYLKFTASMVPAWLPWHLLLAILTGLAFIAAGLAILTNIQARLAAVLATAQIGLFFLLVWVPVIAAGSRGPFQWSETILSFALMAGTWVVSDSYRFSQIKTDRARRPVF